jgi:hypothetical protein
VLAESEWRGNHDGGVEPATTSSTLVPNTALGMLAPKREAGQQRHAAWSSDLAAARLVQRLAAACCCAYAWLRCSCAQTGRPRWVAAKVSLTYVLH